MGIAIIVPDVSFADANLGKVTISGDVPVQALSIIAEDSYAGISAQLRVSYIPIATTQRGVTWSIESGNTYATIDASSGTLTILSGANNNVVKVKVASASNPQITATKEITVSYGSGDSVYLSPEDVRRNLTYSNDAVFSAVNGGFTHNSTTTFGVIIEIPSGYTKVHFQTFVSSGGNGVGFRDETSQFIVGSGHSYTEYKEVVVDIPAGAKYFCHSYLHDSAAESMGAPKFNGITFTK